MPARILQALQQARPMLTKANARQVYAKVAKHSDTIGYVATGITLAANQTKDVQAMHLGGMNANHYGFNAYRDAGVALFGHVFGGAVGGLVNLYSGAADIARNRAGYLRPGEEQMSNEATLKAVGILGLKSLASANPITGAAVSVFDAYQAGAEVVTTALEHGFTSPEERQIANAIEVSPHGKDVKEDVIKRLQPRYPFVTTMGTAATALEHDARRRGSFSGPEV